jgi:hypothetical protein
MSFGGLASLCRQVNAQELRGEIHAACSAGFQPGSESARLKGDATGGNSCGAGDPGSAGRSVGANQGWDFGLTNLTRRSHLR